jgi:hypothetical protein
MNMIQILSIIMVLIFSTSCTKVEEIPNRPNRLEKNTSRIQKNIQYKNDAIFLQRRLKGIETNDLIIENIKNELEYLSDNKFFIQDFCITKEGMLYYIEAGQDIGYEPIAGVRSSRFSIKYIDLTSKKYEIKNLLPEKYYSKPKTFELGNEENFLCFATDFGEIYIIDRLSNKEINILPSDIESQYIFGHHLSSDGKNFIVSINMGTDSKDRYIWKKHKIDLETKELTEVQNN